MTTPNPRAEAEPEAKAGELVRLEAVELARAIRDRTVSCVEVMAAYLDHIERMNPHVNAIVSLQDPELLLRQAEERDRQLAHGQYLGVLHGFPQAIKDLALTKGVRTTMGSPIFADFVPDEDELYVHRMKQHGAIVIGKTNTPEFGLGSQTYNPVFGTTRNPYDLTRTVGGSSGGAAAALALRMQAVADGSDFGGSLRNPAAFNNVFGFRPSFGRVPDGSAVEVFVAQGGSAGPMARTVTDLALLLSVMAGDDDRFPLALREDPGVFGGIAGAARLEWNFRGVRLAFTGDWGGYLPMEPGVLELCRAAFPVLEDLGCVVEEALPDFPTEQLWPLWLTFRHWLAGGALYPFYQDPVTRSLMKPEAVFEVEGMLARTALVGLCQVGARDLPRRRSRRGAGRLQRGQAPAQQPSRACSSPSSCHSVRPTPPVSGGAAAPGSGSRGRRRPRSHGGASRRSCDPRSDPARARPSARGSPVRSASGACPAGPAPPSGSPRAGSTAST